MAHFDGQTYEKELDEKRLTSQLHRVKQTLLSGEWYGLAELASIVDGSEAGVSARLRDLRKERFGGFKIDRRRIGSSGLWEYRLRLPSEPFQMVLSI